METLGVWGPAGYKFIKELGRMTCEKTMEKRSTSFIMQSISMEVQRSNVACITATVDSPKLLNELFELFHTTEDYTPVRTHSISGLKSRVLKLSLFFDLYER